MINVLIVDDEPAAIQGLSKLLETFAGDIKVCATATDMQEALRMAELHKPDLVFLDIEMPGGNGFTLLDALPDRKFLVVFVTAYANYAIRAIRNRAFDYLLKPVDRDELAALVEKVKKHFSGQPAPNYKIRISLKDSVLYAIPHEILYIKGDGRYSHLFFTDGRCVSPARNIKQFEGELQPYGYFRIHKSYLVNCAHIVRFFQKEGSFVEMKDGMKIEISRRKKADFMEYVNLR